MRKAKFNTRRVTIGGLKFDSEGEARRWFVLRVIEVLGFIRGLRRQVNFPIVVNGVRACDYRADYIYEEAGHFVVEDHKGAETDVYRLKRRLMLACYGIVIRESRSRPKPKKKRKSKKGKKTTDGTVSRPGVRVQGL